MRKRWTVLALLAAIAVLPARAAGPLDGKSYLGTITEKGKAKSDSDAFQFANGKFHSNGCDPYGFRPSAYKAKQTGDDWTFTSECTSPKEGSMSWKGTVSGDTLEGTVVWTKPGQQPIEYTFSAKAPIPRTP
jgi:hypothetical protein